MPAHARVRRDGALEVDGVALRQRAEVRAAQGFGRDADGEGGVGEGRYGEAGAIDAYGVAIVAVDEDGGGVGNYESGAAGCIGGVEGGDNWVESVSGALRAERREDLPPRISTMPVNILADERVF